MFKSNGLVLILAISLASLLITTVICDSAPDAGQPIAAKPQQAAPATPPAPSALGNLPAAPSPQPAETRVTETPSQVSTNSNANPAASVTKATAASTTGFTSTTTTTTTTTTAAPSSSLAPPTSPSPSTPVQPGLNSTQSLVHTARAEVQAEPVINTLPPPPPPSTISPPTTTHAPIEAKNQEVVGINSTAQPLQSEKPHQAGSSAGGRIASGVGTVGIVVIVCIVLIVVGTVLSIVFIRYQANRRCSRLNGAC